MDHRSGGQITTDRLFAHQHGVASRCQLLQTGVTVRMMERRLAAGTWVAVQRGVYRVAAAPLTWRQRVLAACLAVDGVASHRSAGALWGLDGISEGPVVVTVAGTNRRTLPGVQVRHTRVLVPGDRGKRDAIPCTSVARTLVDLAGCLDEATLEQVLDSALRDGKTSVAYLHRHLARLGKGRHGTETLAMLFESRRRERPTESRREADVARLLVAAGLPPARPPARAQPPRKGGGPVRPGLSEARIGIEFQSYRHHFGRQAWRRDASRANGAAAEDWLVFSFTEDDQRAAAATVRRAYAARTPPKLASA